jgi:hippurate hydrolase
MVYVVNKVIRMKKTLKEFREALHQIPETSFTEFKTQAYLKAQLEAMGYQPNEIVKTGLYVFIDQKKDRTLAFRTDIDALPVAEETGVPFASKHPGFMHACGHDGHMSMILGLAQYLADKQDKLNTNILLIFQPAEESIGGAKQIVDTGLLSDCNVKAIFGIHLFPDMEEGVLASKSGPFMAMANEVDITVIGKGAHGAMPHRGIDANLIAAKLLIDFQTIQTRTISPLERTIITFGKMEGGQVRNQISDVATMEGTIRSFDASVQQTIIDSMNRFARQYEALYGCTITVSVKDGYLPVINDPSLYQEMKQAFGEQPYHEFKEPLMIAEDFSFYQDAVPGVFFYVGTKNETLGYTYSLHHPKFHFKTDVLQVGVDAYITLLHHFGALR